MCVTVHVPVLYKSSLEGLKVLTGLLPADLFSVGRNVVWAYPTSMRELLAMCVGTNGHSYTATVTVWVTVHALVLCKSSLEGLKVLTGLLPADLFSVGRNVVWAYPTSMRELLAMCVGTNGHSYTATVTVWVTVHALVLCKSSREGLKVLRGWLPCGPISVGCSKVWAYQTSMRELVPTYVCRHKWTQCQSHLHCVHDSPRPCFAQEVTVEGLKVLRGWLPEDLFSVGCNVVWAYRTSTWVC